jgi:predicted small secreted protein
MLARAPAWHHRAVRRLALILVVVAASAALAACGGDDGDEDVSAGAPPAAEAPSPPSRPAEITGPVATMDQASEPTSGESCPPAGSADDAVSSDDEQCPTETVAGSGSLRIDEGTGTYTSAVVRVDDGTTVLRRRDDTYEEASFADVRVGDRVEVWFEGSVGESSPVQGRAAAVVLGV